jgi:hypothetical protein
MVLSKVRFLSIIGAKLRTEVVAIRRPPKFKIAIEQAERLVPTRQRFGLPLMRYLRLVTIGFSPPESKNLNTGLWSHKGILVGHSSKKA